MEQQASPQQTDGQPALSNEVGRSPLGDGDVALDPSAGLTILDKGGALDAAQAADQQLAPGAGQDQDVMAAAKTSAAKKDDRLQQEESTVAV